MISAQVPSSLCMQDKSIMHSLYCFEEQYVLKNIRFEEQYVYPRCIKGVEYIHRPGAQLVEHRAAMRKVVSSTPAGPTLRVLK